MLSVMGSGAMASSRNDCFDGAPCARKLACTVRSGGKSGVVIKSSMCVVCELKIAMKDYLSLYGGNAQESEGGYL